MAEGWYKLNPVNDGSPQWRSGGAQPGPLDDLDEEFYNQFPDAALMSLFPQAGRTNPLGEFLRGSMPRFQSQYRSQLPANPNLTFRSFLQNQNPLAEFSNLSQRQRGEMPGPRVLYQPRRF